MPKYIRSQLAGATYFFTLTLSNRKSQLLTENIHLLRQAYQRANALHPFTTIAICVLPNHLHAIWQMPVYDGDYALRWRNDKLDKRCENNKLFDMLLDFVGWCKRSLPTMF